MRDVADLVLIEELAVAERDPPAVREACVEIFASRKKHAWPPVLTRWEGWDLLWARLSEDEQLERTLNEALAKVTDSVGAIDTTQP